jgi:hypothetical protein
MLLVGLGQPILPPTPPLPQHLVVTAVTRRISSFQPAEETRSTPPPTTRQPQQTTTSTPSRLRGRQALLADSLAPHPGLEPRSGPGNPDRAQGTQIGPREPRSGPCTSAPTPTPSGGR